MAEMTGSPGLLRRVTVAYAAYTVVMLEIERRLRQTGGPGIVRFELAGNAYRSAEMMARWGTRGRRLARVSLWLDFGYMLTYGAHTALLVERARCRQGHSAALPVLAAGAVAGDAIEGVSLLKVLGGSQIDMYARRARCAALVKFAVLAVCLAYAAVGHAKRPKSTESG
ncbi:hypothetical protein [Mycolicibacterium llatzerense]|uniref:hypothetical protein n=1 Tax=Mycolicibacterium llatzerense TaxID=280871 RepID=UPI0021B65513|nr:hypothetical protein [Mycolicibacterium llatzerense]MCT7363850.1 hypothetical protein [Mycolicibacterium llatzerense]MCT7368012.1 hypothetical protein [Mycolicibacterium llatzerense]